MIKVVIKKMGKERNYLLLLLMAAIHLVTMFVLMYSMVNIFSDIFLNINKFYMAVIMTSPMVVLEIVLMRSMYQSRKFNTLVISASAALLIVVFFLIRQQIGVGDKQFLRAMIPHHSSAILMCERASIDDPEIEDLCQSIIASQQAEIDQMNTILDRLE